MKVLVVFGSTSDANISSPLVEKLARHADVEFHVISAHRDLEKLQQKILTWRGDAIVAGAGLAAALPGVVAAMTTLPVFGLPVAAQYAGLDAFASIAQMPPGVPVLTAGPDNIDAIDLFITQMAEKDFSKLHLVVKNADWLEHPDLLTEIAKIGDIDLTKGTVADPARFNIYIVTDEADVDATAFGLHIPFFAKADTKKPENYLLTLRLAQKGGIWVGTNNLRNAVAAAKRLNTRAAGLPDIIYQGSVKDVRGVAGQSPYIFEFSDRYSIFDWGQMPDLLNNKGAALAWMSGFFFDFLGAPATWQNWQAPAALQNNPVLQNLRQHGLSHHAFGLVDGQPRCLAVRPVSVLRPDSRQDNGKLVWDYTAYAARPEHALVPLEVIFRFGVPDGSSLLQRTGDAQYCRDIGLSTAPKAGDVFDVPVIEYSSKLETSDRYMPYAEAQQIAGMNDTEFATLTMIAKLVALRLRDCFADIDTILWDGKIECAFTAAGADGARGFMLVDSIGPDELRLTRDGVHLSKEALRGFYRPTAWHTQLEAAKKLATARGEKDWKRICTDELQSTPPALPATVKAQAEMIYTGIARALSRAHDDGKAFADAWDLDAVVAGFTALKKDAA